MDASSPQRIAIIGLGKLGACMAAVFAQHGLDVTGVDINSAAVEALASGRAPVREPSLGALIHGNAERLSATTDTAAAVQASDATFIIVPTPSNEDGVFVLDFVLPVCEAVGAALREAEDGHLVVITSTVMPGHTGGEIQAALEAASGKVCGEGFHLCYSPEFIALGSVIADMLDPDFVLIGESSPAAGDRLVAIYERIYRGQTPFARMGFTDAEITKLAVNTFVTTKIAYANMLAQVCQALPGADADVVSAAVGLDSRIGRKYLKGAMPFGGPCFPRDNRAFARLAAQRGVEAIIAEATDAMNVSQRDAVLGLLEGHLPEGGRAAILGLSYKPGTLVVEGSPSLDLVAALCDARIPVTLHDPEAIEAFQAALGPREGVRYAESAAEAIAEADVILIAVAWDDYAALSGADFAREGKRRVVIDAWRVLPARVAEVAEVITLGRGPQMQPALA